MYEDRIGQEGDQEIKVLFLNVPQETQSQFASSVTGWSAEIFEQTSADLKHWSAIKILHELGHTVAPNLPRGDILLQEIFADRDAWERISSPTEEFNRAALSAEYNIDDLRTAYVQYQHIRAIGALTQTPNTHITSAAIEMPGEGEAPSGDTPAFIKGRGMVIQEIYFKVSKDSLQASGYSEIARELRRGLTMMDSDSDRDYLNDIIDKDRTPFPFPSAISEGLRARFKDKEVNYVDEYITNNYPLGPQEMYKTVRELYTDDSFRGDPFARQYA